MKYLVVLFLVSCKPPTPAQEVQILKAELAVSSVKCAVYTLNPKYPRDASVTEKCDRLTKP
jgi:hypothetical protein